MTESEKGYNNNSYDLGNENGIELANNNTSTYKTKFKNESLDGKVLVLTNVPDDNSSNSHNASNHKLKKIVKIIVEILLHVVLVAYFSYATYHYHDLSTGECLLGTTNELCGIKFCSGYGMLVLLVSFFYIGYFYYQFFKPKLGKHIHRKYLKPAVSWWSQLIHTRAVSILMIIVILLGVAVFLFFETRNEPQKLYSLVAPTFFILMGYIFSTKRSAIKWRMVIMGILFQFILGIICIRWEVGRNIFECLGNKVATFLGFSEKGSRFVFGDRIVDDGVFAFAILPVIFFFSFFISILYYMGIMQAIVIKLGWLLQSLLGTTVCESVISAANIFLGMSESPLLIRPYISKLTASEIHVIMVSGFATVSGTVLAAYLSFGASAAHLITSSVMAAPATLAIAKLYMPETEESQTCKHTIQLEKSEDSSLLDAASRGASNAIPIVLGIISNIVAFVSFITFLNAIVNWLGFLVGLDDIDFEWIFSKIFIPLAWAMGVPAEDCNIVAKVVATKTIINEFVAYERLGEYTKNGEIGSRSAGIATFAICGFANPSSLGILIGVLSAMAPNRRAMITSVAFRAFIVGSIVCFISASFAGILIQEVEQKQLYDKIFAQLARKNITIGFIERI